MPDTTDTGSTEKAASEKKEPQPERSADQPQEERPISAMLARRLAGAASGYPSGKSIWFTALYKRGADFRFNVSEPYDSRPNAPDADSGVFGPYQTPAARVKPNHIKRIVLELSNGETKAIDPEKVDSLFWSESAVEKFVIPYYGAIGDLSLAMNIQNQFRNDKVVALCHGPNTELCLQQTTDSPPSSSVFKVLAI
jgi:hypothetical protein